MKTKTIVATVAFLLAGSCIAYAQSQDSYRGFHIGMVLSEVVAVGGGNLEKAQAACANPPKRISKQDQDYLVSVCGKMERTLAGQPTEWEFPKDQLRIAFDKGHVIRVSDFNGVIHLQDAQPQTAASTTLTTTREGAVQATAQANAATPTSQSKQQPDHPVVNASAKSAKLSSQPAAKQKVEVINDAFAKAALRALRAIQGDVTTPDVAQGGDILFSKQVVDAIDAADSEARTSAETALSTTLSVLHIQHATNNITLAAAEEGAKAAHRYKSTSDFGREIETRDMLQKDPGIAELKNSPGFLNVNICAAGLETLFRARKSGPIPSECSASTK